MSKRQKTEEENAEIMELVHPTIKTNKALQEKIENLLNRTHNTINGKLGLYNYHELKIKILAENATEIINIVAEYEAKHTK